LDVPRDFLRHWGEGILGVPFVEIVKIGVEILTKACRQDGFGHHQVWDNAGWKPTRQPQHGGIMANKDKGGRNTKSVAAKNLKEKRLDKKAKRTAAEAKRNRTV